MNETHLRILQTTDVHLNLSSYDYFTDRPDATAGLLSLSSVIQDARKEAPNTLLLDTGDFLQGTPLGDLYAQNHPDGAALHPAISLMNAMGYDAGTIGNHEFNFGLDFLTRVISSSRFPIVLANAVVRVGETPLDDSPLYQPYTILDRAVVDQTGQSHVLRIGIIGFVPPQVSIWERRHLQDRVHIRDIAETAQAYIPKMQDEGADIIVALSHSGIAAPDEASARENASMQLAELDGIDVVLCGHQHKRFPSADFQGIRGVDAERGTLHGKPAIMPGHWGRELGVLDLVLSHDDQTGWRITGHNSVLRAVEPETPADATLGKLLDTNHQATLNYIRTPVAETRQPLHTYFTYLGFDLATRVIALAKRERAAQLLGKTDLPLLAAASPFRAGGSAGPQYFTEVETGPLTIRNLSDLYLFPNTLSVLHVTGAQLRDWLERSAGKFMQVTQGEANQQALIKGFPSYNFDMVLGVDYEIDLTQPARYSIRGELQHPKAQRISKLNYAGHPVCDDQEFLVATNSYRAGGAGLVPGQCVGTEVMSTQEEVRTILMNYFRRAGVSNLPISLNWRFAHVPATSLLFPMSPHARRYLPGFPLNITRTDQVIDGYEMYRFHL
ncbi:MAG: bifunctional 2',3'-cyclic-nucleotide 2'-phosphodiesterase/3'-nucleotidase [Thalassovita sp.]